MAARRRVLARREPTGPAGPRGRLRTPRRFYVHRPRRWGPSDRLRVHLPVAVRFPGRAGAVLGQREVRGTRSAGARRRGELARDRVAVHRRPIPPHGLAETAARVRAAYSSCRKLRHRSRSESDRRGHQDPAPEDVEILDRQTGTRSRTAGHKTNCSSSYPGMLNKRHHGNHRRPLRDDLDRLAGSSHSRLMGRFQKRVAGGCGAPMRLSTISVARSSVYSSADASTRSVAARRRERTSGGTAQPRVDGDRGAAQRPPWSLPHPHQAATEGGRHVASWWDVASRADRHFMPRTSHFRVALTV
jgi:hypothetical protein